MSPRTLLNTRLAWRHRREPALTFALAVGLALILVGLRAECAQAVILPAQTIDGPSEQVVGFGGVAMAEDGSGGLVYVKRVEGVGHVFVSRFVGGRWLAPIRVDYEEPFAGSQPRIAAADGGELVVVWATPFANRGGKLVYELLASVLGAGASGFGAATIVDGDIEEATGASPDLAMSSTGQADVVYRVVRPGDSSVPLLRPGDVVEQVRLAHFDGHRWSGLGTINRDLGVSMRPPTRSNAPRIAIGPTGNGVVVWQEPEIEGVARIWARRFFGTSVNYVMPVSAVTFNGAAIPDDADAPSAAFSPLGQAEVAYRQPYGAGSPLPGPRIYLNILPDGESASGGQFEGAAVLDQSSAGGPSAIVGPPSVDIDEKQDVRVLYDDNGTPRVIEGGDRGIRPGVSLGPLFAGAEPESASVMNPLGGGVSAWPSADSHGDPAVAIREDFPGGGVQTGLVSGGAGGEVGELAVGRSGLGDGLVAFRQGQLGNAAIVASAVTAPPVASLLSVPKGWVKPSQAVVSWQPASSADGPLSYRIVLDGRALPVPAGRARLRISPRGLGSGRHRVQVLATDADGQSTLSPVKPLLIAGVPPQVKVSRAGRLALRVRILDPYAGVDVKAVRVSFGDGRFGRGRRRFTHRYPHPGVYRLTALVRDRIGNAATVGEWVSVR